MLQQRKGKRRFVRQDHTRPLARHAGGRLEEYARVKDALYCKYTNGPILLVNSVQSSRLATPFHGASLVASTMCPECRLKAAPPQSDLSAACTGQPSKNIMGSLFEVGLQCRPAPQKCFDEAPGGAGDAGCLLGLLGG